MTVLSTWKQIPRLKHLHSIEAEKTKAKNFTELKSEAMLSSSQTVCINVS